MNEAFSNDKTPFVKILRDTAAQQVDDNLRFALRGAADSIEKAIEKVFYNGNEGSLRDLNGLWSYAVRLHMLATEGPSATPPRSSQAEDQTQLQRKAA